MELREISKWTPKVTNEWEIQFNELYDIEPVSVALFTDQEDTQLIWEQFFSQDLLQIRNVKRGLLLDVGWYPHADSSGSYFLKLLPLVDRSPLWDKPSYVFESKYFSILAKEIHQIIGENAMGSGKAPG